MAWHDRFAPDDIPIGWIVDAMDRAASAGAIGLGDCPASDIGDDLFHLKLLGHSFMLGPSTALALGGPDPLAWLAN